MALKILILNIDDYINGRRIVERLENSNFKNELDFQKRFKKECKNLGEHSTKYPYLLHLPTDFMDLCNDQQFDIENSWVGFVNIND